MGPVNNEATKLLSFASAKFDPQMKVYAKVGSLSASLISCIPLLCTILMVDKESYLSGKLRGKKNKKATSNASIAMAKVYVHNPIPCLAPLLSHH